MLTQTVCFGSKVSVPESVLKKRKAVEALRAKSAVEKTAAAQVRFRITLSFFLFTGPVY